MVSSYLSLAQLNVPQQLVSLALNQLEDFLISSELPDVRWQYQIPELGEGGACSLFGYLQDEPFKLSDYIAQDAQSTNKLAQLQRFR